MSKWMLLLLAALSFAGCQTHQPYTWTRFTLSDPGWKVWNGQAVWKPTRAVPELTGDVLLAVNTNGSAFIEFTKTLPFVVARLDGRRWQVEFPGSHKPYAGHYPLPHFFAWLQLPTLVEGRPPGKGWTAKGGLDQFELHSRLAGETLRGYLAPP